MGTQRDPVTGLRTCRRALPRSPAAVCGPPRLHFYGDWRGGMRDEVQTLALGFTAVAARLARTFVRAGHVRVVGRGVSDALGGVRHGAGLSLRQLGGRGERNVVVHKSVPVKLDVHHLEGRRLGVTETSRGGEKKRSSNLQSLLRASAAPCTFCPAVGQGKKTTVCCFAAL